MHITTARTHRCAICSAELALPAGTPADEALVLGVTFDSGHITCGWADLPRGCFAEFDDTGWLIRAPSGEVFAWAETLEAAETKVSGMPDSLLALYGARSLTH